MKRLNEKKRILLIGCIALVLAGVGSSIFSIPGFAAGGAAGDKTNDPTIYTNDSLGGGITSRHPVIPFHHRGLALARQELQTAGVVNYYGRQIDHPDLSFHGVSGGDDIGGAL